MRGLATGWAMILLLYTLTAAARKTLKQFWCLAQACSDRILPNGRFVILCFVNAKSVGCLLKPIIIPG